MLPTVLLWASVWSASLGVCLVFLSVTAPPKRADSETSDPGSPYTRRLPTRLRAWLQALLLGAGVLDARALGRDPGLLERRLRGLLTQCALAALLALVLGLLIFGWPLFTLALALLAGSAPLLFLSVRRERRREEAQEALALSMDILRSALSEGSQSLEGAIGILARRGPLILRPEWGEVARQMSLTSLPQALRTMQDRLADPIFDLVATALVLHYSVGGRNLSAVLKELSKTVRGQVAVEGEIRAGQIIPTISARLAAIMPFAVLFLMRLLNPEFASIYATPPGQLVIGVCLLVAGCSYLVIRAVSRPPRPVRVIVPRAELSGRGERRGGERLWQI